MTNNHLALRVRLLPLLDVEDVLLRRLMPVAAVSGASLREIENSHASIFSNSSSDVGGGSAGAGEPETQSIRSAGSGSGASDEMRTARVPRSSSSAAPGQGTSASASGPGRPKGEVSVFAGSAWKTAFNKVIAAVGTGGGGGSGLGEDGIDWSDPRDPTRVVNRCGPDMIALWADPAVRALLRAQKLRLEEMPGL